MWKDANKPKNGPIYSQYKQDKLLYKKRIKEEQFNEKLNYTNDLHESLLMKNGQAFWKTWKSKFGAVTKHVVQVDGIADSGVITDKFSAHFESTCTPFSPKRNEELKTEYNEIRPLYEGDAIIDYELFNVELIGRFVDNLSNGKAAGLDDLSAEHIKFCHPIIISILCRLFNVFVRISHIPDDFGASYTVPIPKCDGRSRALSVEDFRGISISPIISKLFEMAIQNKFVKHLETSDHQFGLKKKLKL
jgi:hypothetical protein